MQDVGVTYARYGSPLALCLSHGDTYLQGFPVRGQGAVVNDGTEGEVSPGHGTACGPNADMRIKYSSDFEHLILRIRPQKLVKTLSGLIGRPVDPRRMATNVRPIPAVAAAQLRLVEFVVRELDRTDDPLPALVLAELEQALIDNLQTFLLELGKGFAFVARQVRDFEPIDLPDQHAGQQFGRSRLGESAVGHNGDQRARWRGDFDGLKIAWQRSAA